MYPIPGSRGYLTGLGAVVADSLTVTGNIQGAIVRGTTALEFPATTGSAAGVRCTTDNAVGIGRTQSTRLDLIVGTGWATVENGQVNAAQAATFATTGRLEVDNTLVASPRTVDIPAVGSTVSVSGQSYVEINLSAGSIVSTAAPFIADATNGQQITLQNLHATNTLTLADDGATATNLRLRAATRVLAAGGGYLKLHFSSTTSLWHEIGFG